MADSGRLRRVRVTGGGERLAGRLAHDGRTWESTGVLTPATRYRVVAEAQGLDDRQVAALAANGFAGAFHPGRAAAALDRAVDQLDGAGP